MGAPGTSTLLRRGIGRVLGALLLTAGILKLWAGIGNGSLSGEWLIRQGILIPCAEILLALWLMSGIRSAWSLRTVAVLFAAFSVFTLRKVALGDPGCGCFGSWSLSPKVTYWIDVTAVAGAAAALRPGRRGILPATILLASLLPFAVALHVAPTAKRGNQGVMGQPWPSPGEVDCPADLSRGRWIVLIHDPSCARCRSRAAVLVGKADSWASGGKGVRVALLEVDSPADGEAIVASPAVIRGSLLRGDLYQHAPLLLLLEEGRLRGMHAGWDEVDWSATPYSSWIR